MTAFVTRFDFRAPGADGAARHELYARALDQAAYLDEHGQDAGMVLMPPRGPANVFCAEDPDAFWAAHGHFLLADARAYSAWAGDLPSQVRDDSTTVTGLREAGR